MGIQYGNRKGIGYGGSGGGGGIIPIAPLLWYDAADFSTFIINGGNVSQWNNKGKITLNLSQATASLQPAYNTQQINGLPTVEFDGLDDKLESPSTGLLPSGNPTFTLFLVAKLNVTSFTSRLWGWGITGANNSVHLAMLAAGTRWDASFFSNDYILISPLATTLPTLLTWKYDSGINTSTVFINQSAVTPATNIHGANSIPTPTTFSIGHFLTTMDGVIAEYFLYDQLLSIPQINQVQNYLTNKW